MSSGVIETVEKDTEEREDITDLVSFLMPDADVMEHALNFGMFYNKRIFNGWVKQPSACCGASSVAGAWNALHAYHRTDPQALHHTDILNIYITIIQDKIDKKAAAFDRKLGSSLNSEFWITFSERVKEHGKEIGGKKGFSVTKSVAERVIKAMLADYLHSKSQGDGKEAELSIEEQFLNRNEYDCLLELYEMENIPILTTTGVEDSKSPVELKHADSDEEVCTYFIFTHLMVLSYLQPYVLQYTEG